MQFEDRRHTVGDLLSLARSTDSMLSSAIVDRRQPFIPNSVIRIFSQLATRIIDLEKYLASKPKEDRSDMRAIKLWEKYFRIIPRLLKIDFESDRYFEIWRDGTSLCKEFDELHFVMQHAKHGLRINPALRIDVNPNKSIARQVRSTIPSFLSALADKWATSAVCIFRTDDNTCYRGDFFAIRLVFDLYGPPTLEIEEVVQQSEFRICPKYTRDVELQGLRIGFRARDHGDGTRQYHCHSSLLLSPEQRLPQLLNIFSDVCQTISLRRRGLNR